VRGGNNYANRQFQAKTSKSKNYISETVNRIKSKSEGQAQSLRPSIALRGWSTITHQQIQHGWHCYLESGYDVI